MRSQREKNKEIMGVLERFAHDHTYTSHNPQEKTKTDLCAFVYLKRIFKYDWDKPDFIKYRRHYEDYKSTMDKRYGR